MTQGDRLSVLVMDSSVVYRRLLSEVLAGLPEVERVAATANPELALARLGQQPADMLICDLGDGGRESLSPIGEINARFPEVCLVGVSEKPLGAVAAVRAMEMGVLELIAKPSVKAQAPELEQIRRILRPLLRGIHGRRNARQAQRTLASPRPAPARPRAERQPPAPAHRAPRPLPARFEVVAIGVSTGGPNALLEVIPRLPADLGVPVLLVQHMPPDFTKALGESLDRISGLEVAEAKAGQPLEPNRVYLAPGGRHMVALAMRDPAPGQARAAVGLNSDPPVHSCRPAADVLFRSLAPVYGEHILAVVMTGMGNDGREGVRAIKDQGGYCLTQTEKSCVVYGMPRAVDEAGLSDEKVPLDRLAERIAALVRKGAGG